jgi:hypothetical protein
MKRVDVTCGGDAFVFRTNNDGSCLFTGVSENRQLRCGGGYDSRRRMRAEIRAIMTERGYTGRCRYAFHPGDEWRD